MATTDEESCLWHWAAAVHGIQPRSSASTLRNGSCMSFHSEVDQRVYHPSSLFSSGFIVVWGLFQRQQTLGDSLLVIKSTAPFFHLEGCSQLPEDQPVHCRKRKFWAWSLASVLPPAVGWDGFSGLPITTRQNPLGLAIMSKTPFIFCRSVRRFLRDLGRHSVENGFSMAIWRP